MYTIQWIQHIRKKIKPDSSETSEKTVKIYELGDTSIRNIAARKDVSKGLVQKILKQKQMTGHVQLQPQQQGGSLKSVLHSNANELLLMVKKYPESIVVRIL